MTFKTLTRKCCKSTKSFRSFATTAKTPSRKHSTRPTYRSTLPTPSLKIMLTRKCQPTNSLQASLLVNTQSNSQQMPVSTQNNHVAHEKFFKVHTDSDTVAYTNLQNSKFQILYAIYTHRQEGDGSQQGFFEYVDKFFATSDVSSDTRGQVAINTSLRFSLSLLKELKQVSSQLLENALKHLYEALVDAPAKSLYELDVYAFQQDTTLDEARDFLVSLIREKSKESIVELSLKTIIRLGVVRANPEDLLTACNLIYSMPNLSVDLRNEIQSLPKRGVAIQNAKNGDPVVSLQERKGIINQNLMPMFFHEQVLSSLNDVDGWCTDGKSFYTTYDKLKKYHVPIDRSDTIYLEDVNDEFDTSLSPKGQICFLKGKLYLRNPNKADNIVLVFDAQTLKFDKEATEAIKPSEDAEAITMVIMEKEDKKTGRKLSPGPFFTDGTYFYVVSQKKHIRQAEEDEDAPQLPTALVVEQYCAQEFKHLKSTVLMKNEHEIYSDSRCLDLDTYLPSCSFITNGSYLVVSKGTKRTLFDLTTGLRICKQNNGSCSLIIHDYLNRKCFTFNQVGNYSFVTDFSLQALSQQTVSQETQVEVTDHLQPIDKIREVYLKGFKSATKTNAIQRKMKQIKVTPIEQEQQAHNSGALVVAILLNEIQTNCDEFNTVYKSIEGDKHTSDNYLKFFHWPGATYITSTLFEQIRDLLKHLRHLIDGPKTAENIANQLTFSNVIKVLASNFRAMSYCGLKLPDILEQNSYSSFVQEFQRSITYIIENGYNKEGLDVKACGSLWEDLYTACQDIMTFSIQLVNSDPQGVVSNLALQLKDQSMSDKKAENCAFSLQFLSSSSQVAKLFNIEAQDQIKELESIITSLHNVQTTRLHKQINDLQLFQPLPSHSDLSLFHQACDLFERQIYEQILIQLENANQQLQKKQEKTPAGKLKKQQNQDWFELLCMLAGKCFDLLCQRRTTSLELVLSHYQTNLENNPKDFWTDETKSQLKLHQRQICNLLTIPKQLHILNTYITSLAPLCGDQPQICAIVTKAALELVTITTKIQSFFTALTKDDDSFDKQQSEQLSHLQRRLVFFVGSIAFTLISIKSDSLTSEQLKEETSTQKMARMLLESKIISGGIELRYLNQFAQETKDKMKHVLYHNTEVLNLLESATQTTQEDQLLAQVLTQDQNQTVDLLIKLLQTQLEHPLSRCQYARVGSEHGMTMSRVAFTVMLKYSHLLDAFEQCLQEVDILDGQCSGDLKEMLTDIKQDENFVTLGKLWQEASKIRIWIVEKKNNLSEKIEKSQREQYIKSKKEVVKEGEEEQEYKLTEEDKQEIQDLVFKQLDKELLEIFQKITQKAEYLLKMQVPSTLKHTEDQDAVLSQVPSYLAEEQEKQQKLLQSMHWQERLKSWKQANQVQPKETQAGNTSVLACLLSPISVQKIKARVESHSLKASRRACGLLNISQLLQLQLDQDCIIDLTNWFCSSLRNRTNKLAHYIDEIESCGNHFQGLVKQQFFTILKCVIHAINQAKTKEVVIRLLDALQWKFLGRDHADLVECNIFKCLRQGDGSLKHPIRLAWGKRQGYMTWCLEEEATSLPYVLIQTFDHLFLNIVSRIVNNNGDQIQLKKTGTAIPLIERSKSVISTTVSEQLMGDAFHILFGELNRYCNQLKEFGGVDYIAFSTFFNSIKVNNLKNGSEEIVGDEYKDEYLFDIQKELLEETKREEKEAKEKEEKEAAEAKAKEEQEATESQDKEAADQTECAENEKPAENDQVDVGDVMPELVEHNPEETAEAESKDAAEAEPEQTAEEKELALKAEQQQKETDALTQIQTQTSEFEKLQAKSLHQLYSGRYLKRLLRLLEVFTNVAQTQQAALIMIRRVANPYMLLILINLFTVAEPSNQIMVLKIIQSLINMGTPQEVFEAAIQSVKKQPITKHLFDSEFLQFWGSWLYQARDAIYKEQQITSRGCYEVTQEIARLIACIQQSGHYTEWSQQIKKSLTEQCLVLQTLNQTERDVLFCLMPGADFQRVSVGTYAVTEDNQLLTVLGYRENKDGEVVLGLESTFTNSNQVLVGLYFNRETKDQQEVIELPPHTVKPLVSFDYADNEVTRQPQVLITLVKLLETGDVALQVQILKVISHLITKGDFLQQLKDLDLLQPILLFLFKPRAQQKVVVPSSWLESKITNMKVYASESLKSLVPSTTMKCKVLKQKQLVFTHESHGTTIGQNAALLSSINLHRTHDNTSYFVNFDMIIQKQTCKQYLSFIDGDKLMEFDNVSFNVMMASEAVVTHGIDVRKFVVELAKKAKEFTDAEDKTDLLDWSLVFATVVFVVKKSSFDQIKSSMTCDFIKEHNLPQKDKEESFDSLKQELQQWAGVDIETLMYHICMLPEQSVAAVRSALPQMLLQVEQENQSQAEVLQRLKDDGNQSKLLLEEDKYRQQRDDRQKKVSEILPNAFKSKPKQTSCETSGSISNECELYDLMNCKKQHQDIIQKTIDQSFVANVTVEESVKIKSEQAKCKLYLKSVSSFDKNNLTKELQETFDQLLSELVNQTLIQILNGSDLQVIAPIILRDQRKQLSQFLKQCFNSAQLTFTSTGDKIALTQVKQLFNKLFNFCLHSDYNEFLLEFIKLDIIDPAIKTLQKLESQQSGSISKHFNPELDLHPSLLHLIIKLCLEHRVPCVIESKSFLPTLMQLALGMFVKFWVSSESSVPMKLLMVCQNIVFFSQEYLAKLLQNGVIQKIINSQLLTHLIKSIDFLAESFSEVQRLLLEVYLSIINLKDLAEKHLNCKLETVIQLTSGISLAKRALRIVREKQEFKLLKYLIHKNNQESKLMNSQFGSTHPHYDVKVKAQFQLQEVERMKIKANDKCEFKPFTFLGISQTGDGKNVELYSKEDFKGEGANVQFNSAHFFVYYPVKKQMVIGMGENKRNRMADQSTQDIPQLIKSTQELNPIQICSSRNSSFMLTESGELYHTGDKFNGSCSAFTIVKMPKNEIPDKIFCGRRCKFVIDKEGRTFYYGESSEFELPNNSNTSALKELKLTNDELNPEKIVDIACGYHYNLFVTDKGKLWATGRKFLKRVGLDSEAPIQVNLPQQADNPLTCLRVWASQRKDEHMALVMVKTAKGETQLWSAGKNESGSLGHGGKVKESKVFSKLAYDSTAITFVEVSFFDDHAMAIDQNGKLWAWGNNQQGRAGLAQDLEYVYQPTKVAEFEEMQLTAQKVSCGRNHSLVLALDQNGNSRLYSIGRDEQNFKTLGCTQQQAIECAIRKIPSLQDIDIVDFSASTEYSMIIMKGEKLTNDNFQEHKLTDGQTAFGIMHVYQKENKWHYMSEKEYIETKGVNLPDVCLAFKYPITNMDSFFNGSKAIIQCDLQSLIGEQATLTASSFSDKVIEGVVYTANTKIGGDELIVNLSEQEFTNVTTQFDVHPLIYFRLAKPLKEGAKLPMIDLKSIYGLTNKFGFEFEVTPDLSFIENTRFLTQTAEQFKEYIDYVNRFPVEGDKELFTSMDKQLKVLTGEIALTGVSNFVLGDMTFKDEKEEGKLSKVPAVVKQKRIELLWQYNYYFCQLQKYLVNKRNKGFKGQVAENTSAANIFSQVKHLILGAVKMNFVDAAIDKLPTGGESRAEINRNDALRFEESGKVDHTGEFTVFGQIYKSLGGNYQCWKQNKPDDQALRIDFEGESSIDAGGPYREVLTNFVRELESGVLPLIVKTTNNKTNHGDYRDCYIVNPDSVTPTHQQMFKFLGVLFGYAFRSKSCMPFNMAPLFWKQLVGDLLTEHDLKTTDTYTWQTFQTLRKNAKKISNTKEFESIVDQAFTVVVNGKEVELCENGKDRMVNLENMEEFISLMCKKKFSEGQEQIKWIIEGMTLIIPRHVIGIVQWSDVEDRIAGQKIVDVAKLKSITQYRYCDENTKVVKMFWAVMERMSDEDKTAYLKFVWGRSRMPFDCSTLRYNHRIAVIDYWDKEQLPESHTCFFAVDIPNYESEEILEKKLLISIRFCGEIDND